MCTICETTRNKKCAFTKNILVYDLDYHMTRIIDSDISLTKS